MNKARILKIVVSSPGDVQAERDMIPAIVDELNKGIADERGVRLEVYRWETDAFPAFHSQGPQGQIDRGLRIEDCDLLIGIFWKRFGTPVLDAQSGTEHEIRLALESCEKMGRPQLMIYFNQTQHEPQSQAEKDQWQQVLDFKETLSQKVLWWEYNGKVIMEVPIKVGTSRWRAYSTKTLDPSWIGEWKVSVVDAAGGTLSVNTFSYMKQPETPTSVATNPQP